MKFCPECGAKLIESQKFCGECGTDLRKIINAINVNESLNKEEDKINPKILEFNDKTEIETFCLDSFNSFEFGTDINKNIINNSVETSLKSLEPFEAIKLSDGTYAIKSLKNKSEIIITIPSCVSVIGDEAFAGSDIIEVTLSEGLVKIGKRSFANCMDLDTINFPKSLHMIGDEAFINCSNLNIIIPSDIRCGKDAFKGIKKITNKIDEKQSIIKKQNENSFTGIDEEFAIENGDLLIYAGKKSNVVIPEGVICIEENAFSMCTSLISLTIPKSVKSIRRHAFYNCKNLKNVYYSGTIEDWCNIEMKNVGTNPMEYATNFYLINKKNEYEQVKEIKIPNTITEISKDRFKNFTSLTSIVIPSSVTTIDDYAFSGCSCLKNVIFEKNSKLKSIGHYAFEKCRSLSSITLPNELTTIGYWAFLNCECLTNIILPNKLISIENWAFYNCISLQNIFIPSSVTNIGSCVFQNCNNLVIRCNAPSKLSTWKKDWNCSDRPVRWGAKK